MLINPTACLDHLTGPGHPERPQRLGAIWANFSESGLLQHCSLAQARPATIEELGLVHGAHHIARIQQYIGDGGRSLDADTRVSAQSMHAAQMAAGAAITGVDQMLAGNANRVFCGVRPPGHHAESNKAMGFCLFNNVAIAAIYAQLIGLAQRVLILDWDVHHGNGTQAIFEDNASVFYYSLHQFPFYPGTGAAHETGKNQGKGFTLNRPLEAGSGDSDYLRILDRDLNQLAQSFQPDLVIISAGFDAHDQDPIGNMRISTKGFGDMTRLVMDFSDHCANGRLLSVLEGGYDLDALVESVGCHLEIMCD